VKSDSHFTGASLEAEDTESFIFFFVVDPSTICESYPRGIGFTFHGAGAAGRTAKKNHPACGSYSSMFGHQLK
jgi:hypothetical protein